MEYKKVDVVVIGAGAGGLHAAAILAKESMSVVVCESATQIGGYLAGFKRGDFQFDSSVQWLNQAIPGGYLYKLWNYLNSDFPYCPPLKRIHCWAGPDKEYVLTSNPLELQADFIRDFPECERGIKQFFKDAKRMAVHLKVMNSLMRTTATMTVLEKIRRGWLLGRHGLPMMPFIKTPVEKLLEKYFSSPELRSVFKSQESFAGIIFAVAWAWCDDFQAAPKGGTPVIAKWLAKEVEKNKGEIQLKTYVSEIIVDNNSTAKGVVLDNGSEIHADFVIAACDIHNLYKNLVPSGYISEEKIKEIACAELYESSFTVFLGLDCPAENFGFNEEVLNYTINNPKREDHMSSDPEKSIIMVISNSVRDKTLVPEGKGSLMIHCPANISYGDNWKVEKDGSRVKAYKDYKNEYADVLINRIAERFAPNLRDHIEVKNVATPITYERYTHNFEGTIMGFKPTKPNIKAGLAKMKTPIKNLLIGGHSAEYGGGVPMAARAGANAAAYILKATKNQGFSVLAKIMDQS